MKLPFVETTHGLLLTQAEKKLSVNLALAARMLSLDGHDDFNQGQISARLPKSDRFFIKQAMCGFNEARPDDMLMAFVDHKLPVNSSAPPELPLHQAIYEIRPDVNAIIHSHAPYSLVFGATDLEVLPVSHDGACFQGRIARFVKTSQTVLNIQIAYDVANALGDCLAVLLRNHGSVVVGQSIREATVLAQILERSCKIQLLAQSLHTPFHISSSEDVTKKKEYIYSNLSIKLFWDYCVRRVKQTWEETKTW